MAPKTRWCDGMGRSRWGYSNDVTEILWWKGGRVFWGATGDQVFPALAPLDQIRL
jgi:hypothetical protein